MNTETITAGAKAPHMRPVKTTAPALNVSDEFLADFCEKLNRPGLLTAIARADIGTSSFNRADNIEKLSPSILLEKTRLQLNYAVINSIKPRPDLKRCGNSDIAARNWIIFDLDLKDQSDGFMALARAGKLDKVRAFFDGNKSKIEAILGPIWIAVYSGNGLHLYFHVSSLIDTSDIKKYECFYSSCLSKLKAATGFDFDEKFVSQSQMIRLPGSTNYKVVTDPLPTEVIYHDAKADSSQQLGQLFDDAVTALLAQKIVHLPQVPSQPQQRDPHTEAVREALTFETVLNHFHYSKWDRAKENGTLISAPWREDKNPSVKLWLDAKTFKDRADGSKHGDIFHMIAELARLNINTQFRDVLKIAEQITSIEGPRKRKKTPQPTAATATEEPIQARTSLADFSRFFSQNLPDLSVCSLTGSVGFKDKGVWKSASTEVNWLRALAKEQGLSKNDVEDYLALHARSLNKRLLVDLPEWDKVDRVKDICSRVKLKNMSSDHLETLIKDWGATMMARLGDSFVQNKMPIFRGPQGAGKDVFIRYITSGLGQYYNSCKIGLRDKEIEDYRNMHASIAIHIEELKMKSICPSHFKDLITKSTATWRRMRVDNPTKHWFHCSFIASSNDEEVLTDFTGNRRFWIFDMVEFPFKDYWDYPVEETSQIIAQFSRLKAKSYKAEQEALDDMTAYIKSETPKSPTELILEAFDNEMHDWESAANGQKIRRGGAQDMFAQIARFVGNGTTAMKVAKVLAENGRSRKGAGNRPEYFRMVNRPND